MLQNKVSEADEAIKKHQDIEPAKKPKVLTKEDKNKNEMIAINYNTALDKYTKADKHWRLAYEAYESDKIDSGFYDSDNKTVIAKDLYGFDDEPAPNLSKKGNAAWKKSRKLLVIKNKFWMEQYIEGKKFYVLMNSFQIK